MLVPLVIDTFDAAVFGLKACLKGGWLLVPVLPIMVMDWMECCSVGCEVHVGYIDGSLEAWSLFAEARFGWITAVFCDWPS